MHFDLIVVTISLKMCVKDRRDRSGRLLEKRILLLCIEAFFATGLLTFWSTLTNWQIIFKPLDGFFLKKRRILPMKRRFRRGLSLNVIDILKGSEIRATIR